MKFLSRLLAAAAVFPLIAANSQACSMCMLADPKTAKTYLSMTLFMSILPLALLTGLGFWLWRRYSSHAKTPRPVPARFDIPTSTSVFEHRGA